MAAPNSHKDPYWSDLSAKVESKLGLPGGLLTGIVTRGERSNADQVSSAGARTPFQIIPATRQAAMDKWGIDPYLSPENAAEVAGLLLKDSLARNGGDVPIAVAEYHGGTNRKNWGPITKAYVDRVVGGAPASGAATTKGAPALGDLENDFAKWMKANPAAPSEKAVEPEAQAEDPLAAAFGEWIKSAPAPTPEPPPLGFLGGVKEAITGQQRATAETNFLPEWTAMPELNTLGVANLKSAVGTMFSGPDETAQVLKANFPNMEQRRDEKGNWIFRSPSDGREYAYSPGVSMGDVPRIAGGVGLAYLTGGKSVPAMAGGAMLTQGGIEASQAATGGEFSPKDIAIAGAIGGGVAATSRLVSGGVKAASDALRGARSVPEVNATAAQSVAAQAAQAAAPKAVAPMPSAQLAQTARTAAEGGLGSTKATQVLAEQAAPNAKTVGAAERLGIGDYLQPDHVTTNQAYRELAQAVKSVPGSATGALEKEGLEQVAKRADDLISEIGGTTDVSLLDATLKARMQSTQAALEKEAGRLYSEVKAAVPAQTSAPAKKVLEFVERRAEELGGKANLTPMEKKILGRLSPKQVSKTEAVPGDPLMPGSMTATTREVAQKVEPTYAALDDVRKDLGAAARATGPFKDADTGLAKYLYRLISDDQAAVVGQHGMTDTYNAARQAVAVRKGLEDDMAALFGKELDRSIVGGLSGAMNSLPKGDASKLTKLLQSVPADMRQSVVVSGLNSVFAKNARTGNLNFNSYATWYEGLLRNKQSYSAVMSNLPQSSRKQLSDLYRVSRGISLATRERIATGRIQAVQQELQGAETLVGNIYGLAKRAAIAAPAEAAASAVGLPGAGLSAAIASAMTKGKTSTIKAADALVSSPEFIQAARKVGTTQQRAAAKKLANSKPFLRLVKAAGAPQDPTSRERWVVTAMESENNMSRGRDAGN